MFKAFFASIQILLLILFLSPQISFSALNDFPSLNSSATSAAGGAGRGTVDPYGIVYLNPAGVARLKDRYFSTSLAKDQFSASLIDAGDAVLLKAGLSYRQLNHVINDAALRQFTLTIADQAYDKFTFGFNIHYFDFRNLAETSSKKMQSDLGITYTLTPRWIFGVTAQGYGIQSQGDEVSTMEAQESLAVKSAVGASYVYDSFVRFRFDLESESNHRWSKPAALIGAEAYWNDWIVWRVGYQNHTLTKKEYISTGLGFQGPQFGVHYAYVQDTGELKESRHSVDLGLPF